MKNFSFLFGIGFLMLMVGGCESPNTLVGQKSLADPQDPYELSQEFKDYWYAGVAELTTFELDQARYGEMRKGLATMIFVTEDFSKSRFVKLDYPEKAGDDKVSVLKFNLNKKFKTGIYDYALMQSVFKPVDISSHPHSLRVSTANIEWCGQFLTSARLKENGYEVQYQSYFDGEEDTKLELAPTMLEDELWNLIRIAPDQLPMGEINLIPNILTQELTHHELKVEKAQLTLMKGDSTHIYAIDYPEISRKLLITFENFFPYQILSWEETFETVSGWGMESKIMTTKARKIATTRTDYWEKKYLRHEKMRAEALGLEECL